MAKINLGPLVSETVVEDTVTKIVNDGWEDVTVSTNENNELCVNVPTPFYDGDNDGQVG